MISSTDRRTSSSIVRDLTPSETWRATIVDANRINSRLTGLWLRLNGPRPRRLSGINRTVGELDQSDLATGPGSYARTNTTSLLTCARSAAQADRATVAIDSLQTHYPTRAITVASDPALDRLPPSTAVDDGPLTITTRLIPADSGGPHVGHFESVTITGGPRRLGNPASTAVPLCVPDLPIVLWWLGDLQYDLGMFRDLAASSDRVIVDSAVFGDVARGLMSLSTLDAQPGRSSTVLVDMAWSRLLDWRNLIAQFYDAPPHPDALTSVNAVTIEYVVDPAPGQSAGQASAILLVGWLASRLGWRLDGDATRTSAGLRLVFTSRQPFPVVVRLQPVAPRASASGIASVAILSTGAATSSYLVEQFNERELVTTSTVPGHQPMTRHVVVQDSGDSALLERVLQGPGHDSVFADALATVATAFARR